MTVDPMFNTPAARELCDLLYARLKSNPASELRFEEILSVFDIKPEYGLRRVSGGAMHLIREKDDVEQVYDDRGRPYLKLKEDIL